MKRENNRNNLIITIVMVVVAVVAIIIGAILGRQPEISDDYFVSDDTKLVLSLGSAVADFETDYEPPMTHLVYDYSGDNITGMRIYFAYDNDDDAKEAFSHITVADKDWAITKRLSGKYIVFEVVKSKYDGLTTTEMRQNIESMQAAGTF